MKTAREIIEICEDKITESGAVEATFVIARDDYDAKTVKAAMRAAGGIKGYSQKAGGMVSVTVSFSSTAAAQMFKRILDDDKSLSRYDDFEIDSVEEI